MHPRTLIVSRVPALAALLLFLFGSNYCVVSAWATPGRNRTGLECHATAGAQPHACCAARAAGARKAHPVRTPESPCCMSLTSTSGPHLDASGVASGPSSVVPDAAPFRPAAATSVVPRASDPRAVPLAALAGGPLAQRAPPELLIPRS